MKDIKEQKLNNQKFPIQIHLKDITKETNIKTGKIGYIAKVFIEYKNKHIKIGSVYNTAKSSIEFTILAKDDILRKLRMKDFKR